MSKDQSSSFKNFLENSKFRAAKSLKTRAAAMSYALAASDAFVKTPKVKWMSPCSI